jgi:hypothetical protein
MSTVKLNHPALGEVEIPQQWLDTMSNAEINRKLVEATAKKFKDEGVELSTLKSFTGQAAREITSTSRGIQERGAELSNEMLGTDLDERTTSHRDDFITEVAMEMNPVASWSGLIVGAILDPVTFVNPLRKASRVMRLLGGAGVGGTAGFLTPVREEFGESSAVTTGVGAGLGAAVEAVSPTLAKLGTRVAKKLGYETEKEMQDAFQKATPEERAEMEQKVQAEAEQAGNEYSQSTQPMPPSSGQVDEFVPDMPDPAARAQELADIRRVGDEAEAARKAEQEAELERIRNIGKEAELERIKQVGEDFDINADIKKQIADMEADIAALPSSAKQARFTKDQAPIKNEISQLDTKIANLRKAYNKLSTAKKSADKKPKMADIQDQINKAQARRTQRLGELDFIQKQPERFKQLKEAKKEIIKYKKDGTIPSFVKINKPTTRTDVNVDEALAAKASQLGYKSPKPQQYVPQQPTPELPAQSVAEARRTIPDMTVPELGPKSAGSMGVSIKPSAKLLSRVANFDRRTTETKQMAEALKLKGKPAGAAGKEVPESKEAFQREALQKADEEWSGYWQVDGITGKITMDKVGREAEFLRADINDGINEGNYRNAADWLVKTFDQNKTLSPAELRLAGELFRIADNNMKAGLEALKRIEANDGMADDKTIAIMHGLQMDNAVRDVAKFLADMRTIQRVEEGTKSGWSAVGRELKRIKRLNEEQYKQYKKNRVITQLILGVKCK